jgi:hypothetical protein
MTGELGTILGVWAHPDDEAYLSAGLMARAVDAGSRVAVVTATRGELGGFDPELWPPDRLGPHRESELEAVAVGAGGHRASCCSVTTDGACIGAGHQWGLAGVAEVDRRRWSQTRCSRSGPTATPVIPIIGPCRPGWMPPSPSPEAGRRCCMQPPRPGSSTSSPSCTDASTCSSPASLRSPTPRTWQSTSSCHGDVYSSARSPALAAQASQTGGLMESIGEQEFRRWVAVESFRHADRRPLPVG